MAQCFFLEMLRQPSVLGIDFGTGSARVLLVDVRTGQVIAGASADYPHGSGGVLTDPRQPWLARQRPEDYVAALVQATRTCVAAATERAPFEVLGIGTCATASTPIPVDARCRPLSLSAPFKDNLNAAAWLWKDHTAQREAAEIAAIFRARAPGWLEWCGGDYSAEWYWAKLLRCARVDPEVFAAAEDWLELSDYIPAWLCGAASPAEAQRNCAAAGHKALYNARLGGWPSAELQAIDPRLMPPSGAIRGAGEAIGRLCGDAAAALGLPAGIVVATGGIDAHVGAVGAGVRAGVLVKIMGTSSCDITVSERGAALNPIRGVSGVVAGSVLPGHDGIEAGQAAVGDLYAYASEGVGHALLSDAASALVPGESGLVMLDWINGSRSPLNDARLSGLLIGQTLSTTQAHVYRSAIEATAFGAGLILDQLDTAAVRVQRVVMCGGVAERNPLVARIFADILERPIEISGAAHSGALGAAMFAAAAGGACSSVEAAQARFGPPPRALITPQPSAAYRDLKAIYRQLHEAFGSPEGALASVMPTLAHLRETAGKEERE